MQQVFYSGLHKPGLLIGLVSWSTVLFASPQESTYAYVQELAGQMAIIEAQKTDQHLTIADFYKHLHQPLEAASNPRPAGLQEDNQFLKDWYDTNARYQQLYDRYIIHKQAYVIEQVHKLMEARYYAMSKDEQKNHRKIFVKMLEEFHCWRDHKTMVGENAVSEANRRRNTAREASPQQLQVKRKYSYDQYFRHAKAFQRETVPSTLSKFIDVPVRAAKIGGMVLASPLLFAGYWVSRLFYDAPLYSLATKIVRMNSRSSEQFKDLTVEGKEYLAMIKDTPPNTVNLILPNHRNDMGDVVMMANLKISPAMVFMNGKVVGGTVDQAVAQPLGNIFANIPEFISVGPCKGVFEYTPTEKMLATLARIPNVINYPQGFVANIHEVLGITPAFVPKLLGPILESGKQVRVFPISYEIESSFLWSAKTSAKKPPVIRVAEPLGATEVAQIYEIQSKRGSTMPLLFDLFMRANWLESIRIYPELTFKELEERIRESLWLGDEFHLGSAPSLSTQALR